MQKTVYVGLGSNLGDRRENLVRAVERMGQAGLEVTGKSGLWESAPRDLLDQPWFLNAVVRARTTLWPMQLLAALRGIERVLGRRPGVPKGPRVIDLDILLYGSAAIRTATLTIPHPRMLERRFVLEPLAELLPEYRAALAAVAKQDARRTDWVW